MPAPLIPARWRPAAIGAIGAAVLVTVVLAIKVHDAAATAFDAWALRHSFTAIGSGGAAFLLHCSDPSLTIGVIALVGLAAGLSRRWSLLALAVLAPALAVVLTEEVLKPAVGRYMYVPGVPESVLRSAYSGAFPSGHETGVAAAAALLLVAAGQFRLSASRRTGLAVLLLAWVALAAVGLIRNYYHYATDTVGAVGVAVTVVLAGALAIDAAAPALLRRRSPNRPV